MSIDLRLLGLDREIRSCIRCEDILVGRPDDPPSSDRALHSRPILSPPSLAPIMLIGQAPGLTEYRTGQPFSGGAGGSIRDLFAKCGLSRTEFDRHVYQTSIVKCFPGRKRNRNRYEDRVPCSKMRSNCIGYLRRQIDLVLPRLIIPLGGFASREVDRLRNIKRRKLAELVGEIERWNGMTIIYLPHTSGASRFRNDSANREKLYRARELLSMALPAAIDSRA